MAGTVGGGAAGGKTGGGRAAGGASKAPSEAPSAGGGTKIPVMGFGASAAKGSNVDDGGVANGGGRGGGAAFSGISTLRPDTPWWVNDAVDGGFDNDDDGAAANGFADAPAAFWPGDGAPAKGFAGATGLWPVDDGAPANGLAGAGAGFVAPVDAAFANGLMGVDGLGIPVDGTLANGLAAGVDAAGVDAAGVDVAGVAGAAAGPGVGAGASTLAGLPTVGHSYPHAKHMLPSAARPHSGHRTIARASSDSAQTSSRALTSTR